VNGEYQQEILVKRKLILASVCVAGTVALVWAQDKQSVPADSPAAAKKGGGKGGPPKPGVSTPGVRREMTSIMPLAVFPVEGNPDWQVVTEDAVWVTSGSKNTVTRLDPKTNMVAAVVTVPNPCSGLAAGFGSVWSPNCVNRRSDPSGMATVSRIDIKTNKVVASIPVGPVQGEGGIAATPDGVWLVTDAKGVLSKIDPATNKVIAEVTVPPGSAGVTYGEGYVWVTSPMANMLTGVDPKANKVVYSVEVGPGPRFVTSGAGSAWTLNQGDGTISRVDAKTGKVIIKNIEVGIPGTGGELAFGAGHVWATATQIPISEIDPATNAVVKQWSGQGGDSLRIGFNSIFLSNLRNGTVWRIALDQP
jgi:streptogramin lyase